MRSNEIFAAMSREEAAHFLEELRTEAPQVATLALGAAANAFNLRPEFLRRQPRERQAEWMRRALGRTVGAAIAEEVLASYFLEHELELLTELLDGFGVRHEEGRLEHEEPDSPDDKALDKSVKTFLGGERPEKRSLLLRAFAAQSAVEWPHLDKLLEDHEVPSLAARPASGAKGKAKAKAKPRARPAAGEKPKTTARTRAKPKPGGRPPRGGRAKKSTARRGKSR